MAALENRHQRYLHFLADGLLETGEATIAQIFERLGQWMQNDAPNGCMSVSAIAAYPDNPAITQTVTTHKNQVQAFLGAMSHPEPEQQQHFAGPLFLLHEGVSSSWPVVGNSVIATALLTIQCLFQEHTS